MGNQVEIICKNNGKTLLVDEGTALIDIYKTAGVELPYQVLCAQVNNRTRDLSYRVYQPKQVMFAGRLAHHGYAHVHTLALLRPIQSGYRTVSRDTPPHRTFGLERLFLLSEPTGRNTP